MRPNPKPTHVKLKRHSKAWNDLINAIDRRDGLQCQLCNTGEYLVVPCYHHVIFKKSGGGNGPGDVLENMLTLCWDHHRGKMGIHGGGKDAQAMRERAVAKMREINGRDSI